MKKSTKFTIIGIMLLISLFLLTFMATDLYLKGKAEEKDPTTQGVNAGKQYLTEEAMVILQKNGAMVSEKTLDEAKREYGLNGKITVDELTKKLAEFGYEYEYITDNNDKIYYTAGKTHEANKYYIGESDGYVAIYKANDKGVLSIENPETDVFKDKGKIETLPKNIQEQVKNSERAFDSKEDALYEVSGLF